MEAAMSVQQWLESVRTECGRQHLPPVYVERLVGELSDHVTEFMEDSKSMEASEFQPPSPQQLAQFMLPLLIGCGTVHLGRRPTASFTGN
jgi:hypothetical protein